MFGPGQGTTVNIKYHIMVIFAVNVNTAPLDKAPKLRFLRP